MPKILENVKEKILSHGKEMLINSNYESFNIRDLSIKCEVSIGTIYNYFPNKHELVISIFSSDWNMALERMKNINISFNTIEKKLFKVYEEMNTFLEMYLVIFKQITAHSKEMTCDPCLNYLYPLISEIVNFERQQGIVTSNLSNEKISRFIINNLIILCNDDNLQFEDVFSLIKL